MQQHEPEPENTYVIDSESATEMARLLDQDVMYTEAMGGLFSELDTLDGIYDVLDIACGPGGWAQEVALKYPEMEITAIDISQRMVTYAKAQAHVRNLENLHFRIMNVLHPLDFPDHSFDLINMRFLIGIIHRDKLPDLLAECYRVLRPGGILRWTEADEGNTNYAPMTKKWAQTLAMGAYRSGYGYSETGQDLGLLPKMRPLLRELGLHQVQQKTHTIDTSTDTPGNLRLYDNSNMSIKLLENFLVKAGVATAEEVEQLHTSVLDEIRSENFFMVSIILTAWGVK